MKKILLATMAATMFAACTQNEEVENLGSNNLEMKFNTAVMATTKAGAMTSAKFNKFTLYAYTGTDNATAIISNKTFTKSGDDWASNADKFYWPGAQNVNFYGYSVETMADATYSGTAATAPTVTYTVKTTAATQEDLLVAKVSQNSTTSESVSIPFTHALTKMSFKVAGDDDATSAITYAITSIKITANSTGTYEYTTPGWSKTTSTSVDFTLTNPVNFNGGAEVPVSGNLMMIPQTDATISIIYTISTLGLTTPIQVEKDFTFTDWAAGKNIAYTIKLPSDAIKQMTVTGTLDTDWDAATESPLPKS